MMRSTSPTPGLASVGSKSVQKVAIAAGALVLIAVCHHCSSGCCADRCRTAQARSKSSIHLVQSWTLENCGTSGTQGSFVDISVWENRRGDATATINTETQLIGSNQVILDSASNQIVVGPGASYVSAANLDPRGSRVESVKRFVSSVSYKTYELGRAPQIDSHTSFVKSQSSNTSLLAWK